MASDGAAEKPQKKGKMSSDAGKSRRKKNTTRGTLDHVLTVALFALVIFILWTIDRRAQIEFWVSVLLTIPVVMTTHAVSKAVFFRLSTKAVRNKPKNLEKFKDSAWQFIIHISMTCLGVTILNTEPWWDDESTVWPSSNNEPSTMVRVFYMSQLGVWFYTALSHRFFESRKKDYFVMYTHHVVTLALISGSYTMRFYAIGVMVMYVHDAADIVVDFMKCANYLGLDASSGTFLAEGGFVLNLFTWAYWRLYIFPTKIIRISFETDTSICPVEVDKSSLYTDPVCNSFRGLMMALFLMHCYWYYLMLKIFKGIALDKKAGHGAARDNYEGDSD